MPSILSRGLGSLSTGAGLLVLLTACHAAGPYGYSQTYTALDAEETAVEGARELDPVMANRLPHEWREQDVHFFGVVLERSEGRDGLVDLTLSMRRLATRNLCETGDESTCRVTVGDREMARVHALVRVRAGDDVGETRIKPRSLVRIVGRLQDEPAKQDGSPVVLASYYRHWPPAEYVTEQARTYMRR